MNDKSITSVTALDGLEQVLDPYTGRPILGDEPIDSVNQMLQEEAMSRNPDEQSISDEDYYAELGDGPADWDDEDGRDTTTLLAINAADVLRFRWHMLHPGQPLPEPEAIDRNEVRVAIETIRELNDIDANLNVQTIPDNQVKYLNYAGQIPIPRSVMLLYKSLMFNLHAEGDKVARWGSMWKAVGVAFIIISVIEAGMLLAR
jgi:hypothetical protein